MTRQEAIESLGDFTTPEGFKKNMQRISQMKDINDRHCDADFLMMELLRSLGYGEGVEIFDEMDKWYA